MDSSGIFHINLTVEENPNFYDVFILIIKWVEKGVHGNVFFFFTLRSI